MAIRDIGRAVVEGVRPDGGAGLVNELSTFVSRGLATVTTGLTVARATDAIANGASTLATEVDKSLGSTIQLPKVIPNPLEQFASYTPLWTLACLTPEQYNDPRTYRNSPADLKHIVMSSGGRYDGQRVQTASGTPEFFINNFTMKAVVGANKKSGNSNAFKFEWTIYEPYSMGLLLQSLQVAARNAGYTNYLNNTPFVLRLDFQGYDELGVPYTSVKPKFFTLCITNAKFEVNEGGSTYKMEGVPFNHKGFSDLVNLAFNDVKLTLGEAGTVEELLSGSINESLQKVLNDIEQRLKDDKAVGEKDVYEIVFPTSSSDFTSVTAPANTKTATVNPNASPKTVITGTNVEVQKDFDINEIGGSSLGFDQSKGGTFVMRKNDQRDEKTGQINRDKMVIDPGKRVFQFAQGQSLTAIMNQIILSSDYAAKAIDPKYKTPEGFVKWFRLDVQIELLKFDAVTGDYARKYTFRVVPYFVHETIFSNPNSAPIGYAELQKNISKGYNYIYTGQNVDVLKFDIQINNLFYTGITPSKPSDSGTAADPNIGGGTAPQVNKKAKTGQGPAAGAQLASGGRARLARSPELIEQSLKGGASQTDTEQQVAKAFHEAFLNNGSELVTVNLEILGDPYWIVDSGISNYFSAPSDSNPALTEDGTMNYESGDVYIYLTFRTPTDINEITGLYEFATGNTISPFSGIYRVSACESLFADGTFKQKLTCLRMPGQAADYKDNPPELLADPNIPTSSAMILGDDEPISSSPLDDPGYTDENFAPNFTPISVRGNQVPGDSAIT
jgi:hypothetical protein